MRSTTRSQKGFSLLAMAMILPALIGATGLAVDLGRIFVTKTELQNFADAAALAAAFELDGTASGIADAINTANSGPGTTATRNRWNFDTMNVPTPTVKFAPNPTGAWEANPSNPAGYRFVRVDLSGTVPIYFLRVLPGVSSNHTVPVSAIAGQGLENKLGAGLNPFSPDAQNPADPHFGFTIGESYTLKWAPPGQRKKGTNCTGDADFAPGGGSSDRGYIDIGQGSGNAGLGDAIINGGYYLAEPLEIGDPIVHVQGNKHVGPFILTRFSQDSDRTSNDLTSYTGNGRRLVPVPINNGLDSSLVVGFGLFMLTDNSCTNNNKPCCAIYLSNNPVMYSDKKGAGGSGLYRVKLFN